MADQNLELRRTFDGLVVEHVPSVEQINAARLRFQAVVQSEQPVDILVGRRWSLRIAAVAALVAAIAVVSSVLPVVRPTANAFLIDIAEATRVLPDVTMFPEGAYLYTDVNNVFLRPHTEISAQVGEEPFVYYLPVRTQAWRQDEFRLNRTTVGVPTFLDVETEALYFESGFDELDRVGDTYDVPQEGFVELDDPALWSTDPDELLDQLTIQAELSQAPHPLDRKIIDVAEDLLRPSVLAPPQLRAALIEVIASLDVDVVRSEDGEVAAAISYEDEFYGDEVYTLTFNPDGYLVRVEARTLSGSSDGTIPADTAYITVELAPPVFVDELGVPPAP